MSEIRRIPVRVRALEDDLPTPENGGTEPANNGRKPGPSRLSPRRGARGLSSQTTSGTEEGTPAAVSQEEADHATPAAGADDQVDWQDRALRLQAEMENYRRRQRRLAQDGIESERERLLKALLEIVDDLERALSSPSPDGDGLRAGVRLTHRAALQRLKKENVEQIKAEGRRFDPNWHEAVTTVPGLSLGVAPETVVQVLEPGYLLADRLLRPARVVVAV